jgi:hypothetical protein
LEYAAEEERRLRNQQMQQLKSNWADAAQRKRENDRFQRALPDYDQTKLSASSAQLLDGEDGDRASRKGAQSQQMRRWIQEQIAEKAYLNDMDREAEVKYAETLKIIGAMRAAAEKEESDMRKAYLDRANRENKDVHA